MEDLKNCIFNKEDIIKEINNIIDGLKDGKEKAENTNNELQRQIQNLTTQTRDLIQNNKSLEETNSKQTIEIDRLKTELETQKKTSEDNMRKIISTLAAERNQLLQRLQEKADAQAKAYAQEKEAALAEAKTAADKEKAKALEEAKTAADKEKAKALEEAKTASDKEMKALGVASTAVSTGKAVVQQGITNIALLKAEEERAAQAKAAAEAQAKAAAEAQAKDAEAQAKDAAEAQAKDAEAQAKKDAEAQAKKDAEAQAKAEQEKTAAEAALEEAQRKMESNKTESMRNIEKIEQQLGVNIQDIQSKLWEASKTYMRQQYEKSEFKEEIADDHFVQAELKTLLNDTTELDDAEAIQEAHKNVITRHYKTLYPHASFNDIMTMGSPDIKDHIVIPPYLYLSLTDYFVVFSVTNKNINMRFLDSDGKKSGNELSLEQGFHIIIKKLGNGTEDFFSRIDVKFVLLNTPQNASTIISEVFKESTFYGHIPTQTIFSLDESNSTSNSVSISGGSKTLKNNKKKLKKKKKYTQNRHIMKKLKH